MKKTQTPPITIILYFVGAILIIIGLCLTIRFAIANGERENLKSVYTEVSATVDYVDSVREGRHYKKSGKRNIICCKYDRTGNYCCRLCSNNLRQQDENKPNGY